MTMLKKFGVLISALVLASSASISLAADATTAPVQTSAIKVAVVNVQQVLQQSPRVAELSKKLESQFKERQAKMGDEQKTLQDEVDKFKKEAPTMSQKDRDNMQKEIANKRAEFVKKMVAFQQDLQKEQGKIMQNILTDLNGIVSKIAKAQSYNLVLDSQAVIFSTDSNDITKEVAKEFNEKS